MATNKIISIPQWLQVASSSTPDPGLSKIYPKVNDNFWYILDSSSTEKRLGLDYYFGRGFSSSALLPSPSLYGYEINLMLKDGITFSSNSELTIFGLSPSMLSITGSFVSGYVLSTSTYSEEFKWVPHTVPNINGDSNRVARFAGASTLTSSLIIDTGSAVIIGETPSFVSASFSVKGNVNVGEYLYFNDSQNNYIQNQTDGGFLIKTSDEFSIQLYTSSNYSILDFDYDTSNIKTMNLMGGLVQISDFTQSKFITASNLDYVSLGDTSKHFQLRLISGSQGALKIQDGGQSTYSILVSDASGVGTWQKIYGYNGLTTSGIGIGINLSTNSGLSVYGSSLSIDYSKISSPISYTTTGTLSLATVSVVTSATYGSSTETVRLTLDQFGRVITISTASITGVTGVQGPTGVQGSTGPQGSIGFIGVQGNTGPQGNTGVQGRTGPQGVTGNQGVTGPQGFTGNQGNSGPQGNTGVQGRTGPQGFTGNQGVTGPQGNTGVQGRTGSQGSTGAQGVTGPQGNTGIQGPYAPDIQMLSNYGTISTAVYPSGVVPPPLSGELLIQLTSNTMSVGSTQVMYFSGTDSNDNYRYDFFEPVLLTNTVVQKNLLRFRGDYNNTFRIESITYSAISNYWTLDTTVVAYSANGSGGLTVSYILNGRDGTGPQGITGFQGNTGPQGPAGSAGGGTGSQGPQGPTAGVLTLNDVFTDLSIITITHNTGFYPVVQILGTTSELFSPSDIVHHSTQSYTIHFGATLSGTVITAAGAGPQGPQGYQGNAGSITTNFQGGWTSGGIYAVDEIVTHGGSTWFTTTGASDQIAPTPTHSNWTLFSGAALIVGTTSPSSSTSSGFKGEIRVNAGGYLYIHTGQQWVRSSMTFSTF